MRILVVDPGADWSTKDVFDGLVHGLRTNGHEVLPYYFGRRFGILSNALQQAWRKRGRTAAERGPRPTIGDASLWASELSVTWAMRHDPDVVLIVSAMYFHPDALLLLKQARRRDGRSIPVGILLTESPYDIDKEARVATMADIVWTNERTAVDVLRRVQPRTFYLRHGYHPERHRTDSPLVSADGTPFVQPDGSPLTIPAHDVVFVGTSFQERVEVLSGVNWDGIDLGLYGMWTSLPSRHPLRQFVKSGAVQNDFTAALYRSAKIGLNFFRQSMGFGRKAPRILGSESLGPRNYELAATGCFHVSDFRKEVVETFGELVPTFQTAEELEFQVRRWLADDSGRQAIAARLPVAVRGHSWVERAQQVVGDLAHVMRRDAAA